MKSHGIPVSTGFMSKTESSGEDEKQLEYLFALEIFRRQSIATVTNGVVVPQSNSKILCYPEISAMDIYSELIVNS